MGWAGMDIAQVVGTSFFPPFKSQALKWMRAPFPARQVALVVERRSEERRSEESLGGSLRPRVGDMPSLFYPFPPAS